MAKGRKRKPKSANDNPADISPFMAQHGDYRQGTVVDLSGELGGKRQSMVSVMKNVAQTTVDKWLREGGPGFEEPQARAIDHVRGLWAIVGFGPRLVANYAGAGGGEGDADRWHSALLQIDKYEREFPKWIWEAFEMVVRHDHSAGVAGSRLANNSPQRQAAAKQCVGFVASKIAEWRGY